MSVAVSHQQDTPNYSWAKPLDESIYTPGEATIEFYKKETGIAGDEELKQHIIAVQSKAYSVSPSFLLRKFTLFNHFIRIGFPLSVHTNFRFHEVRS